MGFAITEPDAGSDTASASTTAAMDGDDYVINGGKVMIGNGTVATFLLVYCLTNPGEPARTSRHSIIIVETDRKGYEADRMEGKMGIRCSDTAMVYFSDVRVPRENLVGGEGNGFIQLMHFFDRSRAYVAAHGLGLAQGAMDMAVKQARQRRQFGRPLGSFQATCAGDLRGGQGSGKNGHRTGDSGKIKINPDFELMRGTKKRFTQGLGWRADP